MPIRPGESAEQAGFAWSNCSMLARRLARARDLAPASGDGRSLGRARPARHDLARPPGVDRGDGVFLAGDMVAAPGLLAEVSWASAVEASRLALGGGEHHQAAAAQGRLSGLRPAQPGVASDGSGGAGAVALSRARPPDAQRMRRLARRAGGPSPTNDGGAIAR